MVASEQQLLEVAGSLVELEQVVEWVGLRQQQLVASHSAKPWKGVNILLMKRG